MGATEFIGRLQTGEELVRMSFDLAAPAAELAADPKAQDVWIHCLPGGPDIVARDGRRFRVEDLAAIAKNTELPMLVDWEHRSEGDDTRAAGWIEELRVDNAPGDKGGLWGRVRWTPIGRDHVVKQDYRFLSPVVFGSRDAKKVLTVVKLGAVALTNRPALKLRGIEMLREQLSTRHGAFAPDTTEGPKMDKLTKLIREACGLDDTASEDDLVGALRGKLKPKKKDEGDDSAAQAASLREACTTLTSERNTLQSKLTAAETELLAFQGEAFKAKVETFFSDGARAGKILPANREKWMKFALESGTNFETFKDVIYPGLPVIGAPQGTGKMKSGKGEKLKGKSPETGIDYDALRSVGLSDAQIRESEREVFRSKSDGPGDDEDEDEDEDDAKDDGDTTDKEGAPAGA